MNRKDYSSPQIERVNLDNEISLILVSPNLVEPGEEYVQLQNQQGINGEQAPDFFNSSPFI